MFPQLSLLALIASTTALPTSYGNEPFNNASLTVKTTSGRVHGKVDAAQPDVRQFLGIPFAQPPVGDLRWRAPQPLDQPEQEIEATELGPSCLQFLNNNISNVYTQQVSEYNLQGLNKTGDVSEDCLRLSVYAPAEKKKKRRSCSSGKGKGLPVFIYFYGGGFTTGGMDVPSQIPTQWIQRSQDHIVMTFNYRVNIFGSPNAPGLEDQNLGLLDQRAAVEWAKENIASFGGDPDRMVIWGQSAGSISVDYYSFQYPEDPIASGMSLDSGTVFSDITSKDKAQTNFTFVAENVGCGGFNESSSLLSCMRGVDGVKINDFIAAYTKSAQKPAISFGPVVDEKTVFSNYTERMLQGKQAKIPAIIGTNTEDGVPFAPYKPTGPDPALAEAALLSTFFCPTTESSRLRQQTGLATYRYEYAGNWTNLSPEPWMGAFHSAELPMLFGTHPNFGRGESTEAEYATSHVMQDSWLAFAKDGPKGLEGTGWGEYAVDKANVREFGADGVPVQDVSLAGMAAKCSGAGVKE